MLSRCEESYMNENRQAGPEFDGGLFNENQNNIPAEVIAKYAGLRVAWSLDGTRILASGTDDAEVDRNLRSVGIDPAHVVHGVVERMDGSALLQ
jgi:hypothetical protein